MIYTPSVTTLTWDSGAPAFLVALRIWLNKQNPWKFLIEGNQK